MSFGTKHDFSYITVLRSSVEFNWSSTSISPLPYRKNYSCIPVKCAKNWGV